MKAESARQSSASRRTLGKSNERTGATLLQSLPLTRARQHSNLQQRGLGTWAEVCYFRAGRVVFSRLLSAPPLVGERPMAVVLARVLVCLSPRFRP